MIFKGREGHPHPHWGCHGAGTAGSRLQAARQQLSPCILPSFLGTVTFLADDVTYKVFKNTFSSSLHCLCVAFLSVCVSLCTSCQLWSRSVSPAKSPPLCGDSGGSRRRLGAMLGNVGEAHPLFRRCFPLTLSWSSESLAKAGQNFRLPDSSLWPPSWWGK